MKKIIFISTIFFMLISLETFAQGGDAEQEGSKVEKQKPNKNKGEEALNQYAELARTRIWAIIISQVNFMNVTSTIDLIDVDPRLNFITLRNEDITLQLNFDHRHYRDGRMVDRVESTDFGNINDYIIKKSKKNVLIIVKYKDNVRGNIDRKQIVISSTGMAKIVFDSGDTMYGKFIPLDQAYIHLMGVKIK